MAALLTVTVPALRVSGSPSPLPPHQQLPAVTATIPTSPYLVLAPLQRGGSRVESSVSVHGRWLDDAPVSSMT